jgi:hypothetical protein
VTFRLLALVLSATIFIAQTGCAVTPPTPSTSPPSEDVRSRFGRIAVVVNHDQTSIRLKGPAAGPAEGAGRGALLGTGFGGAIPGNTAVAVRGGRELGAVILIGAIAVAVAILPLSILIGTTYGMLAAPSAKSVEEAVERLVKAVEDADLCGEVARAVLKGGRERTDESFPEQGPYDTHVEIGAPEILLTGAYEINPPMMLAVLLPVRVLQGDTQLYETRLLWRGSHPGNLFQWADQDGARLRAQLEQSVSTFSPAAVHQLFLIHELPKDREWKAAP